MLITIGTGHNITFVLSVYTIFAMITNAMMRVPILLGVVPAKKNTV